MAKSNKLNLAMRARNYDRYSDYSRPSTVGLRCGDVRYTVEVYKEMSTKYKLKKLWGGEQFYGFTCADECKYLQGRFGRCDLYRERLRPCENPEHEDFGKFGRCISCIEGYFPKDEDEVTEK